jgi:hypothetical protein
VACKTLRRSLVVELQNDLFNTNGDNSVIVITFAGTGSLINLMTDPFSTWQQGGAECPDSEEAIIAIVRSTIKDWTGIIATMTCPRLHSGIMSLGGEHVGWSAGTESVLE